MTTPVSAPATSSAGAARFVPLCMTADELAEWRKGNALVSPAKRASRPCEDCIPAFALAMRLEDKCNGTVRQSSPTATEERRAQWRAATARKRAGIRVRRTRAETAALARECYERAKNGGAPVAIAARLGLHPGYVRDLIRRVEEAA